MTPAHLLAAVALLVGFIGGAIYGALWGLSKGAARGGAAAWIAARLEAQRAGRCPLCGAGPGEGESAREAVGEGWDHGRGEMGGERT